MKLTKEKKTGITDNVKTIAELLDASLIAYRNRYFARIYEGDGERYLTFHDLYNDVGRLMHSFANKKKDHIAFICDFSYEFIALFLAVIRSGNIAIPINPNLNKEDLLNKIRFADINHIFIDRKYANLFLDNSMNNTATRISEIKSFYSTEVLSEITGQHNCNTDPGACAAMFFTSGTTNKSKLVMLTQKNLISNITSLCKHVNFSENDSLIPCLPNYHVLGIITGIFSALVVGGTLCISRGPGRFFDDMQHYRPSIMVIVPAIAKTIYQKIMNEVKFTGQESKLKKTIALSNRFRKNKIDLRSILFRKVLNKFGGNIRMILCGGASLDSDTIRFFEAIGIDFLQAYGLTECSPVVSLNQPLSNNPESCGKVIPGVQVRIKEDIILVKGDNVFLGYYKDDVATLGAFEDGWFITSDVGYLDKQDYLHVVGRVDDLIVLSNGENINPVTIETIIKESSSYISDIVVFRQRSDSDKLSAAIIPSELKNSGDRKALLDNIRIELSRVNSTLPSFQRIQKFFVVNDFIDKTGFGKIKRESITSILTEENIV